MKKIVLTLAVVLCAYAMEAASVTWSANNIAQDPNGGSYTSYMAYLVDASIVAQSDMDTALSAGDTSKLNVEGAIKLSTATKKQGTLEKAMFSVTDTTTFNPGSYSLYTVILNNSNQTSASYYMITPATDFTVKGTGGTALGFSTQASNTWKPIPEPTSGLLLLVGGALLALRRKQK